MLKELGLVFSCISLLGSGQPQRNYSHSEPLNDTVDVTYKYESNEVNGADDLIKGNVYHLSASNGASPNDYGSGSFTFNILQGSFVISCEIEPYVDDLFEFTDFSILTFSLSLNEDEACVNIDGYILFFDSISFYEVDCDILLVDYSNPFSLTSPFLFSYSDYNEIEDVTYTPPSTFIGVINEFCQNYIFSEIPLVNEITFTVGGQQISLMTYIVIFVGLVCGIGLLVLFILLLKWLFLLVASGFRLRR